MMVITHDSLSVDQLIFFFFFRMLSLFQCSEFNAEGEIYRDMIYIYREIEDIYSFLSESPFIV